MAAGAALLLAPAAAHAAARGFPTFGAGCSRADFRSGGETIRAERCGPARGPAAVVVLHGCGGFGTFDHHLVTGLPRYGIATLDVDYFASTPHGPRGFCSLWRRDPRLFATWERVAADAAASLRRHYPHVGAVGWSLGAGVAVGAAEDLHAFAAVAAFSALAYPAALARAAALPPSIFLSGGSRDIVPPENSRLLDTAARRAHVTASLFVYPDGTHDWPGRQGRVGIARAAAFLRRVLRAL